MRLDAVVALLVGLALVFLFFWNIDLSPKERTPSSPEAAEKELSPSPALTYKAVQTTLFWVGEEANAENDFIGNAASYWDSDWIGHFGGLDSPERRCGSYPCEFTPRENPFYFALPYGEFDEQGKLKASTERIPWFKKDSKPLLKNRWIEVVYEENSCYGQWQDVGPFLTDDDEYVFGDGLPRNTFGEKAGLDVSPALWDCLGLTENATTRWRFVDEENVPEGPWKEIMTTSGISWE